MTVGEVLLLLERVGFSIEQIGTCEYVPESSLSGKARLLRRIRAITPGPLEDLIYALARR